MSIGYITPGYDKDHYEKIEPVIPRVYHEKLSESQLENLYSAEEIKNLYNKAYFVSNPDKFNSNGFMGTECKYVNICNPKSLLIPGSKTENNIPTSMSVKNTGTVDAYVRLFIAIPSILDDAVPTFDASKNVLHFNTREEERALGKWNFGCALDRSEGQFVGPSGWNCYTTTVDGIAYNVYVATYETAIRPGKMAQDAIYQVYLDAKASEDDIITVNKSFGTDKWQLLAVAESVIKDPLDGGEDCFSAFDKVYTEVGPGKHDPFN